MYREFEGKVAVVTGAAQGIGWDVANELSFLGARVIGIDMQFKARSVQEVLNNECDFDRPILLGIDVSDSERVTECINDIETELGPIDYVVHAAGILKLGHLCDQPVDDWLSTFQVNTLGAFNVCTACAQNMKTRRHGSMVLVGSNASSTPRVNMGAYAASKAASTMMMKCLGLELAEYNVRCNVVAPGSTDTEMQRQLWTSENDVEKVIQGNVDQHRLGIPLKRMAKPENITNSILFLLSNQASQITIETLTVDGGATLGCS